MGAAQCQQSEDRGCVNACPSTCASPEEALPHVAGVSLSKEETEKPEEVDIALPRDSIPPSPEHARRCLTQVPSRRPQVLCVPSEVADSPCKAVKSGGGTPPPRSPSGGRAGMSQRSNSRESRESSSSQRRRAKGAQGDRGHRLDASGLGSPLPAVERPTPERSLPSSPSGPRAPVPLPPSTKQKLAEVAEAPSNPAPGTEPDRCETSRNTCFVRLCRFVLYGTVEVVLFIAWWFGARQADSDGDGDIDTKDVEAFLRSVGLDEQLRKVGLFETAAPYPNAPHESLTSPLPSPSSAKSPASDSSPGRRRPPPIEVGSERPSAASRPADDARVSAQSAGSVESGVVDRSQDLWDKIVGNDDGEFDFITDLVEAKVSGVVQEDEVMADLASGRRLPLFILFETCVAFGLWFLFAMKAAFDGAREPFLMTKAGMDSFHEGSFDLRIYRDCEDLRYQFWRWFTYQFTHIGILHIGSNTLFNVVFGIPLEGLHGTRRLALMYNLGVFGGACCFFVSSPHSVVVGMSGGCYALLGMHVADLVMNWSNKRYRKPTAVLIIALAAGDLSQFYSMQGPEHISHAAHLGGYVAGTLLGIAMGKNLKKEAWEIKLQRLSAAAGLLLVSMCLIWMVAVWPPRNMQDPTDWCWHRQVLNESNLDGEWECVRCRDTSCTAFWGSRPYVAQVSRSYCNRHGWAFSGLP